MVQRSKRFSDSREVSVEIECFGKSTVLLTLHWSEYACDIDTGESPRLYPWDSERKVQGPLLEMLSADTAATMLGGHKGALRQGYVFPPDTVEALDAAWHEALAAESEAEEEQRAELAMLECFA